MKNVKIKSSHLVIARSETTKQSRATKKCRDCFASLAMTGTLIGLILFLSGCTQRSDISQKQLPGASVQALDLQNKKPIKILFVGDMMFDRYIREGVEKYGRGDYEYVLSRIKDQLAGYDLVVGNLEGPITDKDSVSVGTAMDEKKNLKFTFDPMVAKVLAANNIKLVDLGNNHILNQGEDGVDQTKKYLDEAGVQYFGDTGDGSQGFLIKNIGGRKIAFVNYNYAVPGSFEKAIADIKNLKSQTDIVVVCPHWGTEYRAGDPGQKIKDEAHQLIDAGADFIAGGHPHVVQTSEIYKNKKIYYSLGNFVFDQYFQNETMEGLGVELTVNPDLTMEYNELKVVLNKRGQTEINHPY